MATDPLDAPRVEVQLDGAEDGAAVEAFRGAVTAYEIDSDYMVATDGWSLTVYQDDVAGLRRIFRPLRGIRIFVDGNLQVYGRIDATQGAGNDGALRVEGRDYLADVCDGGADPSLRFPKGIDLGDAILSVVKPFGILTIASGGFNLTRNLLTGKRPYFGNPPKDYRAAKLEDFKVNPGTGAWEIVEKMAAHHGFTVQPVHSDPTQVVLSEPEFRQSPLYRLTRNATGNVLQGSARRDYGRAPTVTIATGAGGRAGSKLGRLRVELPTFSGDKSPASLSGNPEVQRCIASPAGIFDVVETRRDPKKPDPNVYGTSRPLYRPMFFEDKEARNLEQLERAARRMIAERTRPTLVYSCTVRGHTDEATGATWAVDTIAHVEDGVEDVDEPLWIQQRTFANDGSGPTTRLVLIRPDSLAL